MTKPHLLVNGPGNYPDADKWNNNADWASAIAQGNVLLNAEFEHWNHGIVLSDQPEGAMLCDGWEMERSATTPQVVSVERESSNVASGQYSAKVDVTSAGSADSMTTLKQSHPGFAGFQSKTVVMGIQVKTGQANKIRVSIDDGVSEAFSGYHTGGGSFELLTVKRTVDASASELTFRIYVVSDAVFTSYLDAGFVYFVDPAISDVAIAALEPEIIRLNPWDVEATIQIMNDPFKNRILNCDMRIDQRNAGGAITLNSATPQFGPDRWKFYGQTSDGVYTAQQSATAPPGFQTSVKVTVTTADASIGASQYYLLQYSIEGYDWADMRHGTTLAREFTVGFWVRSSVTGTFSGSMRNNDGTRSYPFTYTINNADTWELKFVTIPGGNSGTWQSGNLAGMTLTFSFGAGSAFLGTAGSWQSANYVGVTGETALIATLNATWYLTGVILRPGRLQPKFMTREYGDAYQTLQRYFCYNKSAAGWMSTTTDGTFTINIPREMRTTPTIAIANGTNTILDPLTALRNISSITTSVAAPTGGYVDLSVAATTAGKTHLILDGALSADAEL